MSNMDMSTLFAAGAYSVAAERGFSESDARRFTVDVCKQAAAKRVKWDEDDDDEEEGTWWSRNKHWALPAAIGAGAFLLGADAGRNGRKDRSYISNAGSLFWERIKALFGFPNDPWYDAATKPTESPTSQASGK